MGLFPRAGEIEKLGWVPSAGPRWSIILQAIGLELGLKRGEHTWAEFHAVHTATLWQCDFFSQKALTWRGCPC
jgi:hypothetical protein